MSQHKKDDFLFQLHPKDAAENNLLTSYTSQEYQEYTDEKQQKWIGSDFFAGRCRKRMECRIAKY